MAMHEYVDSRKNKHACQRPKFGWFGGNALIMLLLELQNRKYVHFNC